jgi:hypothetical protein
LLDSRKLLDGDKLNILIDSESVGTMLANNSSEIIRLLSYIDRSVFQFLRSPLDTQHTILSRVKHFDKNFDKDGRMKGIHIVRSSTETEDHLFSRKHEFIESIAKTVFKKKAVTQEELDAVTLVFIWAEYNFNHKGILVTENDKILDNRLWLERHQMGRLLNIVNVSEALEIMDIFAKNKGLYLITSRQGLTKGFWYFVSFRSKVPHYHVVSTQILDAFALRFTYLLRSIDEMGLQYYSGVSCDSMDDMLYHFNYFISLTTGIFDNLAIETHHRHNIKFSGDHIPSRISLQNNGGKHFLKELRAANPNLRNYINQHVDFINLIYNIREVVIHREGLKKLQGYVFKNNDASWTANFIVISKDTVQLLERCGDKPDRYNILSFWGMREVLYKNELKLCLEPYKFAKAATLRLLEFSDHYLELLGYNNFIEKLRPGDYLLRTINAFRNFRLGF